MKMSQQIYHVNVKQYMYPPLSYRAVKFIVSYHPELVSNTVISLKNVHPAESNLHVYFF